jgi:hypothetical protein
MQCPCERDIAPSISLHSTSVSRPARSSSWKNQQSLHEPRSRPRQWPFSIGPPVTTIAGTFALAAPMIDAGFVLSQPVSSTTPSIGFERMDSSTSIAIRFR